MRGLEKSYMKRGQKDKQKDTHRDSMKESAKGRFFRNCLDNVGLDFLKINAVVA